MGGPRRWNVGLLPPVGTGGGCEVGGPGDMGGSASGSAGSGPRDLLATGSLEDLIQHITTNTQQRHKAYFSGFTRFFVFFDDMALPGREDRAFFAAL